jgi:hypothetical protein
MPDPRLERTGTPAADGSMSEQEWRASGGRGVSKPVMGQKPSGSLVGALADRFLGSSGTQVPADPALEAARAAAQSERDRRELIGVLCGQFAPKVEKVVTFVMHDPLGQQTGQATAAVGATALGAFLISRLF